MKKYEVTCMVDNTQQFLGTEPHDGIRNDYIGDYVAAENVDEAISIAIDCIRESSIQNVEIIDIEADEHQITVKYEGADGKEEINQYYNFEAKEVEEI